MDANIHGKAARPYIDQNRLTDIAFQNGRSLSTPPEWSNALRSSGVHLHNLFECDALINFLMTETSKRHVQQIQEMASEDGYDMRLWLLLWLWLCSGADLNGVVVCCLLFVVWCLFVQVVESFDDDGGMH